MAAEDSAEELVSGDLLGRRRHSGTADTGVAPKTGGIGRDQPPPEQEVISQAFWHGCAGGQRRAAEYVLGRGADLNWVPDYARGTPLDAANGLGTRQENVIFWLRNLGARSGESE